jgi:hypothetical protein
MRLLGLAYNKPGMKNCLNGGPVLSSHSKPRMGSGSKPTATEHFENSQRSIRSETSVLQVVEKIESGYNNKKRAFGTRKPSCSISGAKEWRSCEAHLFCSIPDEFIRAEKCAGCVEGGSRKMC